jgi:hypothetical protein
LRSCHHSPAGVDAAAHREVTGSGHALAFPVGSTVRAHARPTLAGPVRMFVQVVTAVRVAVRTVGLAALVVRDWSPLGRRRTPAGVGPVVLARLALPTTGRCQIGVFDREFVIMHAVGFAPVPMGRRVRAGVRVLFRGDRDQMGRVHASAMRAGRSALAGLRAVVTGVIHLLVTRLAALRETAVDVLVREFVSADTRPSSSFCPPPQAIAVPVGATGPMPAPASALVHSGHKAGRQRHVTTVTRATRVVTC